MHGDITLSQLINRIKLKYIKNKIRLEPNDYMIYKVERVFKFFEVFRVDPINLVHAWLENNKITDYEILVTSVDLHLPDEDWKVYIVFKSSADAIKFKLWKSL